MTVREHLEQAQKSTGIREPDLDPPDIPPGGVHLWHWFWELDSGRTYSFGGPNPISYSDILSWSKLTGISPTPLEVFTIKQMDQERLKKVK